jgi:acetolactate synthase regulatory subunit
MTERVLRLALRSGDEAYSGWRIAATQAENGEIDKLVSDDRSFNLLSELFRRSRFRVAVPSVDGPTSSAFRHFVTV